MDVEEALEFADNLIHAKTGKHLSDLERKIFLGSWQGYTYEKIYPLNPEYVEKDVGYKLWKKLSNVLLEKVTKKNFRGALERTLKQQQSQLGEVPLLQSPDRPKDRAEVLKKRVFISHRGQEPDLSIAVQFCEAINVSGHQAFMATVGVTPRDCPILGEDWLSQLDAQLKQCDYFLLLLSPQAALSEMVIEELRRAKELRDSCQGYKLVVLPIRVNCSLSEPLNHDLRSYLQGIKQHQWKSPADTPILIQEILNLLANGNGSWEIGEVDESEGLQVEGWNLQPHLPHLKVS